MQRINRRRKTNVYDSQDNATSHTENFSVAALEEAFSEGSITRGL
jgi:hypothetical protein